MRPSWVRETNSLCWYSVILTLGLATAGPSKCAHISYMVIRKGVIHRFGRGNVHWWWVWQFAMPSAALLELWRWQRQEEEESESGMWQTRSNRNVCAGPLFRYLTARVTAPTVACNSTPLEMLQPFLINFLPWYLCKKPTIGVIGVTLVKAVATKHLKQK
jgi:hypothetical protein